MCKKGTKERDETGLSLESDLTSGTLDGGGVPDSGEWVLASEDLDILGELVDGELTGAIAGGSDADKVLEELGTGLLLQLEAELDSAVKELGDDAHLLESHGSGGESRGSDTDSSGNKGRGVSGNGVLKARIAERREQQLGT